MVDTTNGALIVESGASYIKTPLRLCSIKLEMFTTQVCIDETPQECLTECLLGFQEAESSEEDVIGGNYLDQLS